MHASLTNPLIAEMVVDTVAADAHHNSRTTALRVCRLVTRVMHDRASHHLFHSVDIQSSTKFAATRDTLFRSTGVAPYCTALTVGRTSRIPPHTPSPPLPVVHLGTLAEVVERLPNLKLLRLGAIEGQAVFRLPSCTGGSAGGAALSHVAFLSSEAVPADISSTLSAQSIRVVVPPTAAWEGAMQAGTLVGYPTAYANAFRLDELDPPYALGAMMSPKCSVVAFYGGYTDAFVTFGALLPSMSGGIYNLTVSWTAAHILHHCDEIVEAVSHGISACTVLRHLTLGLFVGSTTTVPLLDQWGATLSLIAAANSATLRTLTLVITAHEDAFLNEHLVRFESLEWVQARSLLCSRRCTSFEAVMLKVVGARPEVAEKIEWALKHGLGHGLRIRRSREPTFATFF